MRINLIETSDPAWLDPAADRFSPYPKKADPSASLGMTSFRDARGMTGS